jgi:hydrogenase/urease accessory protein HupE
MKLARKILEIFSLALMSALPASFAYAHPGHEVANDIFHGVLHTEHLLVLLAIGAVVAIGYFIKNN